MSPASSNPHTPKTILIVDDEPNVVMVITEALHSLAYPCHLLNAYNSEQAVEVARAQKIDLLLTDYRMPGAHGLDLVDSVRQLWPNLAAILITAYGSEQLEQQAAQIGIERVVAKPFGLDDLRQTVTAVLDDLEQLTLRPQTGYVPLILVVEDNADFRTLVRRKLIGMGYRVLTAPDGVRGLQVMLNANVDLALLDLDMPHRGGLETLRLIRATNNKLKVIIVSAAVDERARREATELGVTKILTKPVPLKDLAAAVTSVFS